MKNKKKVNFLGILLLLSLFFNFLLFQKNKQLKAHSAILGLVGEFAPQAAMKAYLIQLKAVSELENNSVGNEWKHFGLINGSYLDEQNSVKIYVEFGSQVAITSVSEERGDKYPDIGRQNTLINLSKLTASNKSLLQKVLIYENAGQFEGNMAEFEFEYVVEELDEELSGF